jgi:hypothetical protein
MVEEVEACLDHEPGKSLPYFYHMHQSDFEEYAEQLERLGILSPLDNPPGKACCFSLNCDSIQAETIGYERAETGPTLKRLFAGLFYLANDRRGMTENIGVEFPADCYAHSVMPDMCDLGYAFKTKLGYKWLPAFQEILSINIFEWDPVTLRRS